MPLKEWELMQVADPQWEKKGRVHDWRNYVPDEVQAMWETFTQVQKEALFQWAEDCASSEDWE